MILLSQLSLLLNKNITILLKILINDSKKIISNFNNNIK